MEERKEFTRKGTEVRSDQRKRETILIILWIRTLFKNIKFQTLIENIKYKVLNSNREHKV